MPEATISAGYPRALVDFAATKGADKAALLKRSGLRSEDLQQQDNRIAVTKYLALFEAAIELTGEPALALQYGEAVRMQEISIVGLICEACETTLEVGRQLNRYAALVVDEGGEEPAALMRATWKDGGVWLELSGETFAEHPLIVEAEFARLVWNARKMFENSPEFQNLRWPREMHFMHESRGYDAEYGRVFRAPVVFGSHWNAMLVDAEFLTLKQPPVNRYIFGVLSKHAEALLEEIEASRTMRGRVEALLARILHTGDANMTLAAKKLGVSRQTLLRRLKEEGTTCEQVLDELRCKLALRYLYGKKVSVNETAYLVGFSDAASFSRAFKRWTGVSPTAARESGAALVDDQK